jgi:DNA invertase Pin-like site-specific DNA recombinase
MHVMEAAIYLRQSQDRLDNNLAVSRQRDDCQKLCADRGWTWTEYLDNDTSASTGRPRPAYQEMLSDIKTGRITAVVAWDADRLHRRPRELEDFIDLADEKGLALATVGGDFDLATPTGRGNARMKGVFARMEMEQKSARQKREALQRAEAGTPNWNVTPFGYRKTTKGIALHRTHATMVRDAYAAVLAGTSLHAISKQWNAKGTKTTRGNAWSGATVRQLLLAYRNTGLREYQGKPIGDGDWPALVDRDIFDGVRAILTEPGRRKGGTSSARKHLLTGIAVCGKCDKLMGSGVADAGGRRVYVCKHCFGCTRDMAGVDRLVIGLVVERLSRPDAVELVVSRDRPDVAELRKKATALRAQISQAEHDYDEGLIDAHRMNAKIARVTEKLGPITTQLNDRHKARTFDGIPLGADPKRVGEAFDALPLDRQRSLVAALLDITIKPTGSQGTGFHPETVDYDWKL